LQKIATVRHRQGEKPLVRSWHPALFPYILCTLLKLSSVVTFIAMEDVPRSSRTGVQIPSRVNHELSSAEVSGAEMFPGEGRQLALEPVEQGYPGLQALLLPSC
jgi:hypothetical protein